MMMYRLILAVVFALALFGAGCGGGQAPTGSAGDGLVGAEGLNGLVGNWVSQVGKDGEYRHLFLQADPALLNYDYMNVSGRDRAACSFRLVSTHFQIRQGTGFTTVTTIDARVDDVQVLSSSGQQSDPHCRELAESKARAGRNQHFHLQLSTDAEGRLVDQDWVYQREQ